jgi:hypothetical protein
LAQSFMVAAQRRYDNLTAGEGNHSDAIKRAGRIDEVQGRRFD